MCIPILSMFNHWVTVTVERKQSLSVCHIRKSSTILLGKWAYKLRSHPCYLILDCKKVFSNQIVNEYNMLVAVFQDRYVWVCESAYVKPTSTHTHTYDNVRVGLRWQPLTPQVYSVCVCVWYRHQVFPSDVSTLPFTIELIMALGKIVCRCVRCHSCMTDYISWLRVQYQNQQQFTQH